MDVYEKSLELHRNAQGKIRVESKVELHGAEDLSLAYSPGVAQPCLEIQKDYDKIYEYTAKGNLVAVVTNGTAVLGLGNIGAGAGMPVMEGCSVQILCRRRRFPNLPGHQRPRQDHRNR